MKLISFLAMALGLLVSAAGYGADVRVLRGDWGSARESDIRAVLSSVFDAMVREFPQHAGDAIVVSRSRIGPAVLAARATDGAYQIQLDVTDTRWDQFAYQFSHELCHVFTNFEHREVSAPGERPHQWLEEAICEAVSLVGLERTAAAWETSPPYAHWQGYAVAFREYKARLLSQPHRAAAAPVMDWYLANRAELDRNPYAREKNELMAGALLELLMESSSNIEALAYLNDARGRSLEAFLESWAQACPLRCQPFVARLRSLVAIPAGQRAGV